MLILQHYFFASAILVYLQLLISSDGFSSVSTLAPPNWCTCRFVYNKLQGFFISAESTKTTQHWPHQNGVPDITNWLGQGFFITCQVHYDNSALEPELNTQEFFSKIWTCSRRLAEQIFDGKKPLVFFWHPNSQRLQDLPVGHL